MELGHERIGAGDTEGARRATAVSPAVARPPVPDPAVEAKPMRRRFTAEYKLRILREVERAKESGEVGAILRREGLYSSHLTHWRQDRDRVAKTALAAAQARSQASGRGSKDQAARAREGPPGAQAPPGGDHHRIPKKTCCGVGDLDGDPRDRRERRMSSVEELARVVGTAPACAALTVSRTSLYRRRRGPAGATRRYPTPPRALTAVERQAVCDVLHSERFMDKAPAKVYATLLDEETYLCSIADDVPHPCGQSRGP